MQLCQYNGSGKIEAKKTCPTFCREPMKSEEGEGYVKFRMKRIKANDPVAICYEGISQFGKGDYSSAFKYYSKAAELGDAEAHYKLSMMNDDGVGVEQDSQRKDNPPSGRGCVGGHAGARNQFGYVDGHNSDNPERALKHWIIATRQGCDLSIKAQMEILRQDF